jgi:hypothetical protein
VLASEWVENFIRIKNADTFQVENIDLKERNYLRRLYDTPSRKVLFMTSRQTEKCDHINDLVSLHDGSLVEAGKVRKGDRLLSMTAEGKIEPRTVTWVSRRLTKPCVEIVTRQGHVLRPALTHPLRTWEGWTPAGELEVGARLAAVRQGGEFTGTADPGAARIRLTAYLIGDGGLTHGINFTKGDSVLVDEFCAAVQEIGGTFLRAVRGNTERVSVHVGSPLDGWLEEDGLEGKKSADKQLPPWVFGLSWAHTALFLNRLWATDGHVSQRTRSNYNIVYASMSRRLVEQVQALLWKFGIPSKIRENWPNIYKRRGEKRVAYLLQVETQEGIRRFLRDVGAFRKSENVPLPETGSNNNMDTAPREIQDLLTQIIDAAALPLDQSQLFSRGLPRTLAYPPTWDKVRLFIASFRDDLRYPQGLVDELERHADSDLYWDRIKSIKQLGPQECVDFTVADTHNFVAGGLITHNSTTLGNRFLTRMATRPNYPSLFVTPSAMQTMTFSRARLDDIIEVSPVLSALNGVSNLLEKRFKNGSVGYLRYAFLNADRIRGISAVDLYGDEIQDLLPQVMPVIEEVTSHHQDPYILYSGTPKSYDNTIEKYWSRSSQSEWAVPCERHGFPETPSTWHWNVLDLPNVGKTGPMCARCHAPIRPDHPKAGWVAMHVPEKYAVKTAGGKTIAAGLGEDYFEGLRICRLMVPWYIHSEKRWKELLYQIGTYSRDKLYNEVFARSFDGAHKPLTRADLVRASDDAFENSIASALSRKGTATLFAGVDWGSGSETSYTVLTIGGYVREDNSFQVLLSVRFAGDLADPEPQVREILRLVSLFGVRYVGTDYGFGFMQNAKLTSALGAGRVFQHQYMGRLTTKLKYAPGLNRFLAFRTPIMADVINAIKNRKIRLPSWGTYEKPYGDDFLAINAEYSNTLRMIQYSKNSNATDDAFHSVLYALLASYKMYPRPDIVAPIRDPLSSMDAAHAVAEEMAIEKLYAEAAEHGIDI